MAKGPLRNNLISNRVSFWNFQINVFIYHPIIKKLHKQKFALDVEIICSFSCRISDSAIFLYYIQSFYLSSLPNILTLMIEYK